MVFVPTALFKGLACPMNETCTLVNCIFDHRKQDIVPQTVADAQRQTAEPSTHDNGAMHVADTSTQQEPIEPPLKRRKMIYETLQDKPLSRAELIRSQLAQTRTQKAVVSSTQDTSNTKQSSLERPISPPGKTTNKDAASAAEQSLLSQLNSDKPETLNPRIVTPAPDSHSRRMVFVQHIHSDMARLNRSIKTSSSPIDSVEVAQLQQYILSDQAVIKLALTEEAAIAHDSPTIYGNIVRNRIAAYMRMKPEEWLQKLKSTIFVETARPDQGEVAPKIAAAVSAFENLSDTEMEAYFNALRIKDLEPLSKHGYVIEPPSEAAAEEAQAGVDASGLHEKCDRCGSRFRVYPDRDPETGRLTNNGPCRYHWGRRSFPTRQKTDSYTGGKDGSYRCCGQEAGTVGCTTHADHVFKCSAPARLAAVMPFINTPSNSRRRKTASGEEVRGVVFDCEMGYTTNGLELIRLTALRWPTKEPLLDILVRPLGAIIDLNTRFSGVKPEHFANAPVYRAHASPKTLQVVPDPATARSLLCEFLDADKVPLMGHAIDNDLNATRLCHSFLIDTVLLYPHPRSLPLRLGLKALTKKYLNRDIQMGGSEGHDSFEDAAATLDLILLKGIAASSESSRKGPLPLKRLTSPIIQPLLSTLLNDAEQISGLKRTRAIV